MPSYIVKASRDEDWYVRWSTIVDAPCEWGTRAELAQHLSANENTPDRWERADHQGTSANWPDWDKPQVFGWEHEDFILMESSPDDPEGPDGWWSLPRANLRAFCERLDRGEDTTDLCRWEVFTDEETP